MYLMYVSSAENERDKYDGKNELGSSLLCFLRWDLALYLLHFRYKSKGQPLHKRICEMTM